MQLVITVPKRNDKGKIILGKDKNPIAIKGLAFGGACANCAFHGHPEVCSFHAGKSYLFSWTLANCIDFKAPELGPVPASIVADLAAALGDGLPEDFTASLLAQLAAPLPARPSAPRRKRNAPATTPTARKASRGNSGKSRFVEAAEPEVDETAEQEVDETDDKSSILSSPPGTPVETETMDDLPGTAAADDADVLVGLGITP
jgi:hypothetical protein